MLELGLKNHST